MFLSISMIVHPLLFSICFIALTKSQGNTIGKACGVITSNCAAGQTCVNGRCECDPGQRGFWAGEKKQCRVCPSSYNRLPTRCYKFFSTLKNQTEARADCRRDQADLFSWRDNSDESILIDASTARWSSGGKQVHEQFYSWGGGIINHGRGTKADYKITWFDSKAPTMLHPDIKSDFTDRYCSGMLISNYRGDPEPTRRTKNAETENCVSYVFIPQPLAQGLICMADDYCSTKMSFICELTEATIDGLYQTAPPPVLPTDTNGVEQPFQPFQPTRAGATEMPDALGGNEGNNNSRVLIYIVGLLAVFVIFGIVAFIIIRKRKQKNEAMEMASRPSVANSNISDASAYSNA